MIIKVCGVRDPENIRNMAQLDIDWLGLNFCPGSPRYISNASSNRLGLDDIKAKRVGVFVDEMPQTIMTCISRYSLDIVQLHGTESAVMIQNLKRSIQPDIREGVKMIKVISVADAQDFERCKEYEGVADYLLFDTKGKLPGGNGKKFQWSLLEAYKGSTPFLLSGGIGPDDADRLRKIKHPQFMGVDVNSKFEIEPGVKDIHSLSLFIQELRD